MISSSAEDEREKPKSDFSIDHILNRAGHREDKNDCFKSCDRQFQIPIVPFPWIHCTRYCPPKLPRTHRREGPHKRQLGRHPRIPFTSHQLQVLEEKYCQSPYLSSAEVKKISKMLQLADVRVKIWFQNRRARERREKMQTENEKFAPNEPPDVSSGKLLSTFDCSSELVPFLCK